MELNQLRGFYEIAREGSFTRAADKLYLTQPAISLQVKALEEELDVALFERNRRQIRLTPAGEVLVQHARGIFEQLAAAQSEIAALQDVLRGQLVIGTSDTNCTYVLPELLRTFAEEHLHVEVDVRNKMSSEVVRLVLDDAVDFGLATLPVRRRDLVTAECFRRREAFICPPDHPLGGRKIVRLEEIAQYPVLALERGSTSRHLLDESCRRAELVLPVSMNLGSIEVIKRFVESGLGVAVVPQVAVAGEVADGRLAAASIRGVAPRSVGIVERKGRRRAPATEVFIAMLQERLAGEVV